MTADRGRKWHGMTYKQSFASTLNPKISKRQHLSQLTQAATDVENVKSIVGLRPTRWYRDTRSVQNRSYTSTKVKSSQQLSTSSGLVAATRYSSKKTIGIRKQERKKEIPERVRHGAIHVNNSRYSNPCSIVKNDVAETPSDKTKPPSEATKISFSFAPLFVPSKCTPASDDAIGDDSGDESRVITTTRNTSFLSSPPFKRRRQTKTKIGKWAMRLVTLRNANINDSVRLQNKAFPMQRMLLDVTDPRRRAKTYTDVTILGQYSGPWINVPEDTKITLLGYTHRHVQRIEHWNARKQRKDKHTDVSTVTADFFAWFTFSLLTARCIDLEQGCKLRIYNAIILPCRLPVALDISTTLISILRSNTKTNVTTRCEKCVICTHMCERINSFN